MHLIHVISFFRVYMPLVFHVLSAFRVQRVKNIVVRRDSAPNPKSFLCKSQRSIKENSHHSTHWILRLFRFLTYINWKTEICLYQKIDNYFASVPNWNRHHAKARKSLVGNKPWRVDRWQDIWWYVTMRLVKAEHVNMWHVCDIMGQVDLLQEVSPDLSESEEVFCNTSNVVKCKGCVLVMG